MKKAAYDWSMRLFDTPGDVRAAVPLLVELHRARSENGYGVRPLSNHLPTQDHRRFLEELLPRFAAQGQALIAVLYVADVPVAAQAFLMVGGVLTFYYSGFHTVWNPYSPLLILAAEVID